MHDEVARALSAGIAAGVEHLELAPLIGGACQDNYRIDAIVNGEKRRYVLRSDAKSALPGSLGRKTEHDVIRAARRAGVKTPNAFGLAHGLVRPEAYSYFMDWIDGEGIGAKVLRDPALAAARASLPETLARELAAIHSVTPELEPELVIAANDAELRADPAAAALARHRAELDRLPQPRPALELILSWLAAHPPPRGEVTLVHGDFRVGNFLVAPGGLTGVLDWEFARWGSPFEDVAWLCLRDWRFGQLKNAAGGLCPRAEFYALYTRASGRAVDPDVVRYWEIMGNVRWAIGAFVQGLRYLSGTETDFELIAIGRRAQEMELEAIRLIDRAERGAK